MKIVQINATCGVGSTGKICVDISRLLSDRNIENYILYCSGGGDYPAGIRCADDRYIKFQALRSRILSNYGFNSQASTRRIICELERIRPDIVHLHNIHGHDCNLEVLLEYLKKKQIKLYWTFHDCWAFTAYCTYFDFAGCSKWKTGCRSCPQRSSYTWFADRSPMLYKKKKELMQGLDLTIITPSEWLANLVHESFLKDFPVKVINNGVDLEVFRPMDGDVRERYGIPADKYIVLGVAFGWEERKGLDVFTELAERLDDRFKIVLVGTDDRTDRRLPENIVSVHRTQDQKELAMLYTCADLFVNPTREDNFPTANIEALACGTPVLTFRTGGSPEIPDESCGSVVEVGDINSLEREIVRICESRPYSEEACVRRGSEFDKRIKFQEYVKLYLESGTDCC